MPGDVSCRHDDESILGKRAGRRTSGVWIFLRLCSSCSALCSGTPHACSHYWAGGGMLAGP